MWTYQAEIRRVVDADTIDLLIDAGFGILLKERIRLARVDAWEVRGEEREQGLLAKARVEELLPVGSIVIIETSRDKGKYGRYIAEILIVEEKDGVTVKTNLGDLLMAEGHATEYGK